MIIDMISSICSDLNTSMSTTGKSVQAGEAPILSQDAMRVFCDAAYAAK